MADVTYTDSATVRRANEAVLGKGESGSAKIVTTTVAVTTGATGRTYKFGRYPSNARIHGNSNIYWDDLATSGAPDLDFGVASVDSNITSDPDALNDGLNGAATGSSPLVKDRANYGKRLWEFVNGQTTDPGGELDIYMTLTTAPINAAGDVTVEVVYSLD